MMPASLLQWIALFGFATIATLFLTELRRWKQLGSIIGHKQRICRIVLIALVEILFGMMYASSYVTGHGNPLAELLYWMLCLFIGLTVIVIAVVDLREVIKSYAVMCRRTFSDLGGDQREK